MNRVRIHRALAALTLAGSLATGSFAHPGLQGPESPLGQQAQDWSKLHGTWSGVQKPKQVVIKDDATWKTVWAEHAQGGAAVGEAPKVDFTKEAVVAVFLGNRMTSVPVETTIERKNGEVVVSVKEGGNKPYSMPVMSQPFEIVKIAKAPVIRIQDNSKAPSAPKPIAVAADEDTGLRNAVGRVSGKLQNVFGTKSDTLAFDGGAVGATTLANGAVLGAPKASLYQLPPPPGEQKKPKSNQGLPPPPGQQQPSQGRQGGGLPPPPGGQQGQLPPPPGGNQGNLPPPPQYRGRPNDSRNLPPPPGHNSPIEDSGVVSTGYWHIYRDVFGSAEERYGDWRSETASANISRGGSETGVTQGTRYTSDLSSREFRRRYVLYWRWIGFDCDPNDSDRCARWERQYKYFYEDTRYSKSRNMRVVVNFAADQPLVAWEKESFRVLYDGSRVWIDKTDPAFHYTERGPIVDQQTGVATITLTPGARILRGPEANKVNAYIANDGGKLKFVVEDSRTREYAGEALEVTFEVWRDDPAGWRNLLGRDTKMAERTTNGPARITVTAGNTKHVIDLGVSGSAEYYIDKWSFRRANSKISSGNWVRRGKGNRVKM